MNSDNVIRYGDIVFIEGIINETNQSYKFPKHCDRKLLHSDVTFLSRFSLAIHSHQPEFKNIAKYLYSIETPTALIANGSPLKFGSSFLLKPLTADVINGYIKSNDKEQAHIEKDNYSLQFQPIEDHDKHHSHIKNDPTTLFRLQSTLAFRNHGIVYYTDEIHIQSVYNHSLYFHVSDLKSTYGSINIHALEKGHFTAHLEVNMSNMAEGENKDSFIWKFIIYDRIQSYDSHSYRIGQKIRLLQAKSNSYLSGSSKYFHFYKNEPTNEVIIFSPSRNPIYFLDYDESSILSSKTIFHIEDKDIMHGGPIVLGRSYRLRHSITGGYLYIKLPERLIAEISEIISKNLNLSYIGTNIDMSDHKPVLALAKFSDTVSKDSSVFSEFLNQTSFIFFNLSNYDSQTTYLSNETNYVCIKYSVPITNNYSASFVLTLGDRCEWSCKLYPDISTDKPGMLSKCLSSYLSNNLSNDLNFVQNSGTINNQVNLHLKKSNNSNQQFSKSTSEMLLVSLYNSNTSKLFGCLGKYESLQINSLTDKKSIKQFQDYTIKIQPVTLAESHILIAINQAHTYYINMEYILLRYVIKRNLQSDNFTEFNVETDSILQSYNLLRKTIEFILGTFNKDLDKNQKSENNKFGFHQNLFDDENEISGSALETSTQYHKRIYRNQLFSKYQGILKKLFDFIKLPYLLNISWFAILTNPVLKQIYMYVYSLIEYITYNNSQIQHFIARSRYNYKDIYNNLSVNLFNTDISNIINIKQSGYLREIFNQLKLSLGGVSIIRNVLTNDIDLFMSLVNQKLLRYLIDENSLHKDHIFKKLLNIENNDIRENNLKYLKRKKEKIDYLNNLSAININFITLLNDFVIFKRHNYFFINQLSILNCSYKTNSLNYLIDTCIFQSNYNDVNLDLLDNDISTSQTYKTTSNVDIYLSWSGLQFPLINSMNKYNVNYLLFGIEEYLHQNNITSLLQSNINYVSKYNSWVSQNGLNSKLAKEHYWIRLIDLIELVCNLTNKNKTYIKQCIMNILLNYIVTLDFIASLCENRNETSIEYISQSMTFNLLIAALAKNQIPLSIQSRYLRLIRVLYIDRYPIEDIQLPHRFISNQFYGKLMNESQLLSHLILFNKCINRDQKNCNNVITNENIIQLIKIIKSLFYGLIESKELDKFSIRNENPSSYNSVNYNMSTTMCCYEILLLYKLLVKSGNISDINELLDILELCMNIIQCEAAQELQSLNDDQVYVIEDNEYVTTQDVNVSLSPNNNIGILKNIKAIIKNSVDEAIQSTKNQIHHDSVDQHEYELIDPHNSIDDDNHIDTSSNTNVHVDSHMEELAKRNCYYISLAHDNKITHYNNKVNFNIEQSTNTPSILNQPSNALISKEILVSVYEYQLFNTESSKWENFPPFNALTNDTENDFNVNSSKGKMVSKEMNKKQFNEVINQSFVTSDDAVNKYIIYHNNKIDLHNPSSLAFTSESSGKFDSSKSSTTIETITSPNDISSFSLTYISESSGLPDMSWEWISNWCIVNQYNSNEWEILSNGSVVLSENILKSFKNDKIQLRRRTLTRLRKRKGAYQLANELNKRGYSWTNILNVYKLYTLNHNEIINLSEVINYIVEKSIVQSYSDNGYITTSIQTTSTSSSQSIIQLDKELNENDIKKMNKNNTVTFLSNYMITCMNVILSIYDIKIYIFTMRFSQDLYALSKKSNILCNNTNNVVIPKIIDQLIQNAITGFKSNSLNLFNCKNNTSSNLQLSNRDLHRYIFSLILSSNHSQCDISLTLLFKQYNQSKIFINHLTKILLCYMVNCDEVLHVVSHIDKLKYLTSNLLKYNDFNDDCIDLIRNVEELIAKLKIIKTNYVNSNNNLNFQKEENMDKPNDQQDINTISELYRSLDLHDILYTLLFYIYDIRTLKDSFNEILINLNDSITKFLIDMLDTLASSSRIYDLTYIDVFLDNLDLNSNSIVILYYIMKNNRWVSYNTHVNTSINKMISSLLTGSSVIEINQLFIKENYKYYFYILYQYVWQNKINVYQVYQNIKTSFDTNPNASIYIFKVLFSQKYHCYITTYLLPGNNSYNKQLLIEHCNTVYNPEQNIVEKIVSSKEYLHYISLFYTLLALCCTGGTVDRQRISKNKIRCKQEISIVELLIILQNDIIYKNYEIVQSFILYIYCLYIEGSKDHILNDIKELCSISYFWLFIKKLLDTATAYTIHFNLDSKTIEETNSDLQYNQLVINSVLPFLLVLFHEIDHIINYSNYSMKFYHYSNYRIQLFHILELIDQQNRSNNHGSIDQRETDELRRMISIGRNNGYDNNTFNNISFDKNINETFNNLFSLIKELDLTIDHDNGSFWKLTANKGITSSTSYVEIDENDFDNISVKGKNIEMVELSDYQSFINYNRLFKNLQKNLLSNSFIQKEMESDFDILINDILIESGLCNDININRSFNKKCILLNRLIRFAREEIDLNLSSWPKGENRKQAIKAIYEYKEIQNVIFIFDILYNLVVKFSNVNKSNQFKEKIVSILSQSHIFHLIIETISNCCYKELVFKSIRLFNVLFNLISYNTSYLKKLQSVLYFALTSHIVDNTIDQAIDITLDKTVVNFFSSLNDRLTMAVYVRRLFKERIDLLIKRLNLFSYLSTKESLKDSYDVTEDSNKDISARDISRRDDFYNTRYIRNMFSMSSRRDYEPISATQDSSISSTNKFHSNKKSSKNKKYIDDDNELLLNNHTNILNNLTCINEVMDLFSFICVYNQQTFQNLLHNETNNLNDSILYNTVELLNMFIPSTNHLFILTRNDFVLINKITKFIQHVLIGNETNKIFVLHHTILLQILNRVFDCSISITSTSLLSTQSSMDLFIDIFKLRNDCLYTLLYIIEGRIAKTNCQIYNPLHDSINIKVFQRRLYELWLYHSIDLPHYVKLKKLISSDIKLLQSNILNEGFPILILYKYFSFIKPTLYKLIQPLSNESISSLKKDYMITKDKLRRKNTINKINNEVKYLKIYTYYSSRLRSIEVYDHSNQICQMYYKIPEECLYITNDNITFMKDNLLFNDEHSNRLSKLLSFVSSLMVQLDHYSYIINSNMSYVLILYNQLDIFIFINSLVINFILVISLHHIFESNDEITGPANLLLPDKIVNSKPHRKIYASTEISVGSYKSIYQPKEFEILLQILVIIQFLFTLLRLIQILVLNIPSIYHHYVNNEHFTISTNALTNNTNYYTNIHKITRSSLPIIKLLTIIVIMDVLVYYEFHYLPFQLVTVECVFLFLYTFRYMRSIRCNINNYILKYIQLLFDVVVNINIKYNLFYFILSCICLNLNLSYFNPIILTIIIKMSKNLQNMLKAVSLTGKSLLMTGLLGLILLLIFTMFGFWLLTSSFYNVTTNHNSCSTMLECFTVFLHYGILFHSGIFEYFDSVLANEANINDTNTYTLRLFYDFAFFVIINILFLDIIFGMVVDTFSNLREETKEIKHHQNNYCFICGLSKESFNKLKNISLDHYSSHSRNKHDLQPNTQVSSFTYHIKAEHNMWDYLYFIIYLFKMKEYDMNTLERSIYHLIKQGDMSWVPRGECIAMSNDNKHNQHPNHESRKPVNRESKHDNHNEKHENVSDKHKDSHSHKH